ncbi:hypothetical protein ACFWWM_25975 [Streptomyces sp. NPDC058682]|uniref:hypothetical protein n=1 Tax=Streptomyces sp. NPDC058682 TaxID=3346596 RepID=UPI003651239E
MAQSKFDKQLEADSESVARGIGRILAGRDLDGIRKTNATFWRSGTRVLPKVEGRVPRRSYRARWRRLSFHLALGAGVVESGYLAGRDPVATAESVWEVWEAGGRERDPRPDPRDAGVRGIGAASAAAVDGVAYVWLTRERRELMHEWVIPLHEALAGPLGPAEQADPRRYLHIPKNIATTTRRSVSTCPRALRSPARPLPIWSCTSSPWRASCSPGTRPGPSRTRG